MRTSGGIVAFVLLTLLGCKGGEDKTPKVDAAPAGPYAEQWVDGSCRVTAACRNERDCDDFEVDVRSKRDSATAQCVGRKVCAIGAEIGKCGSHRYVHFQDALGKETRYFSADGKLVAGTRTQNGYPVYCGGKSNAATYGIVPTCTHVLTEDIVPGSDSPRLGVRDGGR